jgi:gamma-glutamylcyclotransferase (GGCT)/AIG2-like uncharacterized protein YtfP
MKSGKFCALFVYGTLMPGEVNFAAYCRRWQPRMREGKVRGRLFALPAGYPALVPGNDWVHGWLLEFPSEEVLAALDELEDYAADRPAAENEYQRVLTDVFSPEAEPLGTAWTYIMDDAGVRRLDGQEWRNVRWTAG